ncbi:MAG: hypothetical protein H0V96_05395 [Acidimicrobiia bacterium]|nr:hypothetical protein [Acidimicrobiia bacterium]
MNNKDNDKNKDRDKDSKSPEVPPPPHHEDRVSETTHTVTIGGKRVGYTVRAGHLVIKEEEGKKQASFFSVAYVRNGVRDRQQRPVVFSFNGGPGSSSVWLHLGVLGPRRVQLGRLGEGVPAPGRLVDNEHSLLL